MSYQIWKLPILIIDTNRSNNLQTVELSNNDAVYPRMNPLQTYKMPTCILQATIEQACTAPCPNQTNSKLTLPNSHRIEQRRGRRSSIPVTSSVPLDRSNNQQQSHPERFASINLEITACTSRGTTPQPAKHLKNNKRLEKPIILLKWPRKPSLTTAKCRP